ncbi:MAG TPA: adenylate cyclase [Herpetosiphon sp.]|uniref:Adenylate-forming enzyme n=1 Tax=Herpetosiphon aurantiacus (strain ATCC 23779 / DSM 785 / 114-95) TaxID=316274 RepID=A9AUA6_HERA2|nr:F390 synthetase-related protein [Herpetosiphon sp.]ABX03025.1 putative adenylate-forming enzyme [Herpetosiphon aurantiacus DSM 785]HBW50872.1 adenylate cyclase [Herpetosiphon sp.]
MSISDVLTMGYHFGQARWRWQRLNAERLPAFQATKARQLIAWVAQHSAFYRQHWQGHDLNDWRNLPAVDKGLMMANFREFNTLQVPTAAAFDLAQQAEQQRDFVPRLGNLTVGLSSGTSGHRGLFLVSAAEQLLWAGTILGRTLHQIKPTKIAFFLRANSNLYQQLGGRLIQFRYFDLTQALAGHIQVLNDYRPTIIVAPPALLLQLLAAAQNGQLTHRPERIISVADALASDEQQQLSNYFGIPIEQIYQATEGLLGISCAHGNLHLQEDIVAVDFEDLGQGRVTPYITDLWRRTQPIIRYRLNDVLRLSAQPCRCGSAFAVIEQIEGRRDDLCYFTCHGQRQAIFPDSLRRAILLAHSAIQEYQITQTHDDQLTITLMLATAADTATVGAAVEQQIKLHLADYGCTNCQLSIGFAPIEYGLVNKRRRVIRQ